MPDDAMEIWKREAAIDDAARLNPPKASQPPPGAAPGPIWGKRQPFSMGAGDRLALRFLVPALLGGGFALLVLLLGGVSEANGPAALVPFLLGGGAALVTNRRGPVVIGWAVVAWLAAFCTAVVVAPVLLILDFLDCWASWLSDC